MTQPNEWMAAQLQHIATRTAGGKTGTNAMPLEVPRYSPTGSKPGTIKVGSASWAVLAVLRTSEIWMTHAQILLATKRSTKAVCWALSYLQALGLIGSGTDTRNSRYKRYRAKKDKSTVPTSASTPATLPKTLPAPAPSTATLGSSLGEFPSEFQRKAGAF